MTTCTAVRNPASPPPICDLRITVHAPGVDWMRARLHVEKELAEFKAGVLTRLTGLFGAGVSVQIEEARDA
jgi:hypothetical protein